MRFFKNYRAERRRLRLQGEEVSQVVEYSDCGGYGSILPKNKGGTCGGVTFPTSSMRRDEDVYGERAFVASEQLADQPRWFL